MSWSISFEKKIFDFKVPSGTSRGILTQKKSWFLTLSNTSKPGITGIGECSVIEGLSPDFISDEAYESVLQKLVEKPDFYISAIDNLRDYPSIYFGLEMALKDYLNGGKELFYDTPFVHGKFKIPINGLIWMGDYDFMLKQVKTKIDEGFRCIKMKIGAIDFKKELSILELIRKNFSAEQIEIRVDANGAFEQSEALQKLEKLATYTLHSIEQPIKQGAWTAMRELCTHSPLPIALDEELIGISSLKQKEELLQTIQPQYIILKPSLVGGFKGTEEWINLAHQFDIPWWITSALESNVGLNAIAQFTSKFEPSNYQGLGTGSLYTNNIPSKLHVENGYIQLV